MSNPATAGALIDPRGVSRHKPNPWNQQAEEAQYDFHRVLGDHHWSRIAYLEKLAENFRLFDEQGDPICTVPPESFSQLCVYWQAQGSILEISLLTPGHRMYFVRQAPIPSELQHFWSRCSLTSHCLQCGDNLHNYIGFCGCGHLLKWQ